MNRNVLNLLKLKLIVFSLPMLQKLAILLRLFAAIVKLLLIFELKTEGLSASACRFSRR